MKCPVCANVDLMMAERQGVEIDYCPKCRGVWLDRGELDKIVELSAPRSQVADKEPRLGGFSDDRDDFERGRRRRKSLLGELLIFKYLCPGRPIW